MRHSNMSRTLPGRTDRQTDSQMKRHLGFRKQSMFFFFFFESVIYKPLRTFYLGFKVGGNQNFGFLLFFCFLYFTAFISQSLLSFHLPGNGRCEHFDKWPERWSRFSPASFLRTSEFFCEIQFGELLYRSPEQKNARLMTGVLPVIFKVLKV